MNTLPQNEDEVVQFVRRLFYDASDDGCRACALMDFAPMADDQKDMEHRASYERLAAIEPLFDHIAGMAAWLARLGAYSQAAHFEEATGHAAPDEMVRQMEMMLISVLTPSVISAVSALVDTGALKVME